MQHNQRQGAAELYATARTTKQYGFGSDDSLFSRGQEVWTLGNARDLRRRFVENPDLSKLSFEQKLKKQLAGASDAVIQLAGELLSVYYWIIVPSSMGGAAKRAKLEEVLRWAASPVQIPERFAKSLDWGLVGPGTFYLAAKNSQFEYLVEILVRLKALSVAEQKERLADPWQFKELAESVTVKGGSPMRLALLYLLFPDSFEPIVSKGDREKITDRFRALVDDPPQDVDRLLLKIRQHLTGSYGEGFTFYDDQVKQQWDNVAPDVELMGDISTASDRPVQRGPRYWAISPGNNASEWQECLARGTVAIDWNEMGDLRSFESREEMRTRLQQKYPSDSDKTNDSLACWQFANDMQIGDVVFAKNGLTRVLGAGRIASAYSFDETRNAFRHVRRVTWERVGDWEVPDGKKLPLKTLTDISGYHEIVRSLLSVTGLSHDEGEVATVPEPQLYGQSEAMDGLFMSSAEFGAIVDSLASRKNLILQGAPGVGKTHIAKRVAYSLIGSKDDRRVQMVQFHQSYSYEDFVQGFRPTAKGTFELRDGVFYRFCTRAKADERTGRKYVFIVDEINRGNLSRIFGELLMLIEPEKRGAAFRMPLTYAPDLDFYVPSNVYVLGLMNTADRSLSMVDYALRRRFRFATLEPQFESPVFRAHLSSRGATEQLVARIIDRMTAVNSRIGEDTRNLGDGYRIGHSFFCGPADLKADEAWYRGVIEGEILPLLREYWLDDNAAIGACEKALLG